MFRLRSDVFHSCKAVSAMLVRGFTLSLYQQQLYDTPTPVLAEHAAIS
jgi:hypothetical protein